MVVKKQHWGLENMAKVIDGEGVLLDEIVRHLDIASEPLVFKGSVILARPFVQEEFPGINPLRDETMPTPSMIYDGEITLKLADHRKGVDVYQIWGKPGFRFGFTTKSGWQYFKKERRPSDEIFNPYIAAHIAGYGPNVEVWLRVAKQ